jgi:hypothetical protein
MYARTGYDTACGGAMYAHRDTNGWARPACPAVDEGSDVLAVTPPLWTEGKPFVAWHNTRSSLAPRSRPRLSPGVTPGATGAGGRRRGRRRPSAGVELRDGRGQLAVGGDLGHELLGDGHLHLREPQTGVRHDDSGSKDGNV